MFCGVCGKEIKAGYLFCTRCGEPADTEIDNKHDEKTQEESNEERLNALIEMGEKQGSLSNKELLEKLGHDPTTEEIAEEIGMSVEKVREIIKIMQEEDGSLGDFIPGEDASEPVEGTLKALLKEHLSEALNTLTPREEKVLRLRFGLDDGHTHLREEIAKELNVTTERIRYIEEKAIKKIFPSRYSRSRKKKLEKLLSL